MSSWRFRIFSIALVLWTESILSLKPLQIPGVLVIYYYILIIPTIVYQVYLVFIETQQNFVVIPILYTYWLLVKYFIKLKHSYNSIHINIIFSLAYIIYNNYTWGRLSLRMELIQYEIFIIKLSTEFTYSPTLIHCIIHLVLLEKRGNWPSNYNLITLKKFFTHCHNHGYAFYTMFGPCTPIWKIIPASP